MIAKQSAAKKAVELIKDGMTVGLGSGSTARYAIMEIGERVRQGLNIRTVATSLNSESLAKDLSITVLEPSAVESIDIAIDGADEVDKKGNLIKGGGGSLLREKIIAFASKSFYVMVDESKLVGKLGTRVLPVEVIPFGANLTFEHINLLGGKPAWRKSNGKSFITDNGNLVADCQFGEIGDPARLDTRLKMIPGVVETGLFLSQIVTGIVVGYETGEAKIISMRT